MAVNDVSKKSHGRRKFYEMPIESQSTFSKTKNMDPDGADKMLKFISRNVIGKDAVFSGPFGSRKVVYCDYIASGRAMNSIESYIVQNVLPLYGNTHTSTTVTSLQSSLFVEEARMNIRNAVRASEYDAVIFTGNGTTGAIHKLINALDFKRPPVVFVGPYEHHSNLLPWRNIAVHIIPISEKDSGGVNLVHLELALKEWSSAGFQLIGCFSAASNVTGVVTNAESVNELLHQYNALGFWDYATAGPYLNIDMHPNSNSMASMDAMFFSMHKFVGGVDSPGVLVAKRSLFSNKVPQCGGGGGSVFFVTRKDHRYLQDEEMREEGGTPRVVGIVRAALAMKLKQSVGIEVIMAREDELYKKAIKCWKDCPNLHLLGNHSSAAGNKAQHHLAIFSFVISYPGSNLYLHHNFVAALLNDMFGIQARGGCACAGPYAQDLLGIDEETALKFEEALLEDSRLDRIHLRRKTEYSAQEVLRPGFVRLNFPYFMSDEEVDFVIKAVDLVARDGWRMLPKYMFNSETGEWRHTQHRVFEGRSWLGNVDFTENGLDIRQPVKHNDVTPKDYEDLLEIACDIFLTPLKSGELKLPDHSLMFVDNVRDLRWFAVPSEASFHISGKNPAPTVPKCAISVRQNAPELSHKQMQRLVKIPKHVLDIISKLKSLNLQNTEKCSSSTIGEGSASENYLKSTDESKTSNNANSSPSLVKDIDLPPMDESCSANCTLSCVDNKSRLQGALTNISQGFSFKSPPKKLFKLTAQAIEELKMIQNEDRILVCLSGGKDSLSLLHVLRQYQYYAKKNGVGFELGAVTVDPMTSSYDPSPLIPYLKELEVPYFYEKQGILDQALEISASSICSFCSRMKRGRLYACARREGWNVLAFGQHLDDLAESFLMSAFHNGFLRTMKANYTVKEGDLRVIRPFIYVRETDTRQFAQQAKLPVIPENCPACFEAPKERHRMKQLLASQEILHPRLFNSLKEAMMPLFSKSRTGMESNHQQRNPDDYYDERF
ncbi:uncharacterized protein LOC143469641 [Clavelina lepadiformis]|uniref:uncharacterized protein LOC143469641 n=1 Tax=Clavelina lepadiformis TaxID=159417 RepID=UPI00404264D6